MRIIKDFKQKTLNKKLLNAYNGNLGVLQRLLAEGADIHARNPAGKNILDLTWVEKNITFCLDQGLTFSNQDRLDNAMCACVVNPQTLSRLIAMGGDVNHFDNGWYYPLHQAITAGSEESILLLLENNANVNNKNHWGLTPLHVAVGKQSINAIQLLLKYHARVDILNDDNNTPIDYARELYRKTQMPAYQEVLKAFNVEPEPPKLKAQVNEENILFVHEDEASGVRITQTFNFVSGTYNADVYFKATDTQSNTTVDLDLLKDTVLLDIAMAKFIEQGGVPKYSVKKHLDKF